METLVSGRPVSFSVKFSSTTGTERVDSCKSRRREGLAKDLSKSCLFSQKALTTAGLPKSTKVGRRKKPIYSLKHDAGPRYLFEEDTEKLKANEHSSSSPSKKAGDQDQGFLLPYVLASFAAISILASPFAAPLFGSTTLFVGNLHFYPEHDAASSVQSLINVSSTAVIVGATILVGNLLSALSGQGASASSPPSIFLSFIEDLFGSGRRRGRTRAAAAAAAASTANVGGVGTSTWERFMASDPWANEVPLAVPSSTVAARRTGRKKKTASKVTQPGQALLPSIPFPPRVWGDIEDKVAGALVRVEEVEVEVEEEEEEGIEHGREGVHSTPIQMAGARKGAGLPPSPSLSLEALQPRACCQLMRVTLGHLKSEVATIPEMKRQLSAQQWRLHCQDLLAAARGAVLVRWLSEAIPGRHVSHSNLSRAQTPVGSFGGSLSWHSPPLQTDAVSTSNGSVTTRSNGSVTTRFPSEPLQGADGGAFGSGVLAGDSIRMGNPEEKGGFWKNYGRGRESGVIGDVDKADFYADLIYYLRFKQFRRPGSAWLEQSIGGASGALASALALEDMVTCVADAAAATYLSSAAGTAARNGFALGASDAKRATAGGPGKTTGGIGGEEEEEEEEEADELWPLLVHPSLSSTRALERFRNEVAFRGWLRRNFSSVAAMYEDCHEVVTIHCPGWEQEQAAAGGGGEANDEPPSRAQHLWNFLIRGRLPQSLPLSQQGLRQKQQSRLRKGGRAQGGQQRPEETPKVPGIEFAKRRVFVRRAKELRSLTGWRFVYSLYLELADVVGPIVRAVVKKLSQLLTFVLGTLIGRSVRILCNSIKQNLHSGKNGGQHRSES